MTLGLNGTLGQLGQGDCYDGDYAEFLVGTLGQSDCNDGDYAGFLVGTLGHLGQRGCMIGDDTKFRVAMTEMMRSFELGHCDSWDMEVASVVHFCGDESEDGGVLLALVFLDAGLVVVFEIHGVILCGER